jgi:hypothetical protein
LGQLVEIRGLDDLVSHEGIVGPRLVIREDEEDVRALGCGDREQEEEKKKGKDSRHGRKRLAC